MLTDLKLRNCEGITSVSVAAISHCYMLEVGVPGLDICRYFCAPCSLLTLLF